MRTDLLGCLRDMTDKIFNCTDLQTADKQFQDYIRITVTGNGRSVEVYRNPLRTDCESFRTDLLGCLRDTTDKISNCAELQTADK